MSDIRCPCGDYDEQIEELEARIEELEAENARLRDGLVDVGEILR